MPPALAEALDDRAKAERLTAGAIARRALAAHLDAALTLAVPIRRYRSTRPAPSLDTVRLAELRHVTGEAVGTLRQVAGLDRERGGARLDEIDGALSRLVAAAHALDDWKERAMRAASHDEEEGTPA